MGAGLAPQGRRRPSTRAASRKRSCPIETPHGLFDSRRAPAPRHQSWRSSPRSSRCIPRSRVSRSPPATAAAPTTARPRLALASDRLGLPALATVKAWASVGVDPGLDRPCAGRSDPESAWARPDFRCPTSTCSRSTRLLRRCAWPPIKLLDIDPDDRQRQRQRLLARSPGRRDRRAHAGHAGARTAPAWRRDRRRGDVRWWRDGFGDRHRGAGSVRLSARDDHRRAHHRGARRIHPGGRSAVEPGRERTSRRGAGGARRQRARGSSGSPDRPARASRRPSLLSSAPTASRGLRVAVLAVDPSSPYSGGALLGDRIRMAAHINDPDVLIRSVADPWASGRAGRRRARGDPAAGRAALRLGRVGDGRRRAVRDRRSPRSRTRRCVVLNPGAGDAVQAAKAGLLEVADIVVVNKADRDGADQTVRDLHAETTAPILKLVAAQGQGIAELVETIDAHQRDDTPARRLARARCADPVAGPLPAARTPGGGPASRVGRARRMRPVLGRRATVRPARRPAHAVAAQRRGRAARPSSRP